MKKIGLVLIFALIVFGCSACSVNLTIDTDDNSEKKAETVETVTEPAETPKKEFNEENTNTNVSNKDESKAFYGVWCCGSESKSDADNFALKLADSGFDAQVFVTTDWEELNPEKFYVVTAGVCETKQEAEQLLGAVKENGYSDAYIKYTGERK